MITNTKTRLVSPVGGGNFLTAAAAALGGRHGPDARGDARAPGGMGVG